MRGPIVIAAGMITGILAVAGALVLRPLPEAPPPKRGPRTTDYAGSVTDWQAARATRAMEANTTLTARLLFTPGRRPRVVEPAAPDAAAASSEPLRIYLRGTVLSGDRRLAILIDPTRTEPVMAHAGDRLSGGWRVETVDHGRVRISRGEQEIELRLNDEPPRRAAEPGSLQTSPPRAEEAREGLDPEEAARRKALRQAARSGLFDPE
ncbi:MAG: hypothetical protein ACFB6R_11665 [Alphaproteobacteria bacterium]